MFWFDFFVFTLLCHGIFKIFPAGIMFVCYNFNKITQREVLFEGMECTGKFWIKLLSIVKILFLKKL